MLTRSWVRNGTILVLASTALAAGCRTHESAIEASSAPTTTAPTASLTRPRIVAEPGASVGLLQGVKPPVFRIPMGPRLAILPGEGLGPVRFGATVQTVERLLDGKCAEKTETLCRMPSHALDFVFKDGVVEEMRIQGEERPFSDKPDDTYGVFNGRFAKGATLGMYRKYVIDSVGEPVRVEKFDKPLAGPFPTIERDYYENMVLEYDRLENGNDVLAGVILTRPTGTVSGSGSGPASKSSAAPKPSAAPKSSAAPK